MASSPRPDPAVVDKTRNQISKALVPAMRLFGWDPDTISAPVQVVAVLPVVSVRSLDTLERTLVTARTSGTDAWHYQLRTARGAPLAYVRTRGVTVVDIQGTGAAVRFETALKWLDGRDKDDDNEAYVVEAPAFGWTGIWIDGREDVTEIVTIADRGRAVDGPDLEFEGRADLQPRFDKPIWGRKVVQDGD